MKWIALLLIMFSAPACKQEPDPPGKILHLAHRWGLQVGDPAFFAPIEKTDYVRQIYDPEESDILHQIYEPLYEYDYEGPPGSLRPLLAEGMPNISASGTEYTIRIKRGVRFQDDPAFTKTDSKGREVTAHDFVYSWKRMADRVRAPYGHALWRDRVVGFAAFGESFGTRPEAEILGENISGVQALDQHTLRIRLKRPDSSFVHTLAQLPTAVVPREAVEYYGPALFPVHPVGTGPFVLEKLSVNRVVLLRNPNYHARLHDRVLPLVDGIVYRVVRGLDSLWKELEQGKIDVFHDDGTRVMEQLLDVALSRKLRVVREVRERSWILQFNMEDPLIRENKALRTAIARTINTRAWPEAFSGGYGLLQTELAPPGLRDRCGEPYRWPHDERMAEVLFKKAGYPDGRGLPTPYVRISDPDLGPKAHFIGDTIKAHLARMGVRIEVIGDSSTKRKAPLVLRPWQPDFMDVTSIYSIVREFSPTLRRLHEKLVAAKPGVQRQKLVCEIERLLQNEIYIAYGFHEQRIAVQQTWVKNHRPVPGALNKWKYVDLEKR